MLGFILPVHFDENLFLYNANIFLIIADMFRVKLQINLNMKITPILL